MCCVWLIFVPLCWRRRNSAVLPPLEHSKKYLVQQKASNRICPIFFLIALPRATLATAQGPIGTSKKNGSSKGTLADMSAKKVLHFLEQLLPPQGHRNI